MSMGPTVPIQPKKQEGMNISRWSIEHPYIIIAFFLAMVVLAVIAIGFYMPRRLMPYVQSPMIGIVSRSIPRLRSLLIAFQVAPLSSLRKSTLAPT